jgi:hypothetical protein
VTWRWLALRPEPPADAALVIPVTDETGAPVGAIAAWGQEPDRPQGGLRVDHRALLGGSPATWVSLALLPDGAGVAFDDGAVTGALRRRLAAPWPGTCSTLLVDWGTFGGALTAGERRSDVEDDPFARVAPRRLLRVPSGSFGPVPAPTGPGVTRYGSGNPWPWDRYAGQVS